MWSLYSSRSMLIEEQICIDVNEMDRDTYEDTSNGMTSLLSRRRVCAYLYWREQDGLRHIREDFE